MNIHTLLAAALAAACAGGGACASTSVATTYVATIDAAYFEQGGGAFLFFDNSTSFAIDDLQLTSVAGAYAGQSLDFGPLAAGDETELLFDGPLYTAFATDYDDNSIVYDRHGQPVETVYQFSAAYGGQTFLSHRFSPSVNATGGYVDFLGIRHDDDFPPVEVATLRIRPAVAGSAPEPAAWSLMLLGVGLTGSALRRRRAAGARMPAPPRPVTASA